MAGGRPSRGQPASPRHLRNQAAPPAPAAPATPRLQARANAVYPMVFLRGEQTRACQRARSLVSPGGTEASGSRGCSSLLSPGGTVPTSKEGRRHLKGAGGEQRIRAQSRGGGTTPAMVAPTQRHQYPRSPTAHLRLDLYRVGLSLALLTTVS